MLGGVGQGRGDGLVRAVGRVREVAGTGVRATASRRRAPHGRPELVRGGEAQHDLREQRMA